MSGEQRVIVSCTSTHDRLECLYYTMHSIFRQSLQPDAFYVNLSRDPYLRDQGVDATPEWLDDERVTVNFVDNIGSYRKLVPLLDDVLKNDLIITIDDDVLYHVDWLKTMVKTAHDNPGMVICGRAKFMKKNILGGWQGYYNWNRVGDKRDGIWLLPIGCSGVAYRKSLLCEAFLKDKTFLEIARTNDDLWFRMAGLIERTRVHVDPAIERGNIALAHQMGLEKDNTFFASGSSLFNRLAYRLYGRLLSYFGIALSRNDASWKRIWKYALQYGRVNARLISNSAKIL